MISGCGVVGVPFMGFVRVWRALVLVPHIFKMSFVSYNSSEYVDW